MNPAPDSRARFEATKFGNPPQLLDLSRDSDDSEEYDVYSTQVAWEAWQAAIASRWTNTADGLPKCSHKPDSLGVEVLIWPPHEDGSRTAFYGRRQTREPNFYKYGAVLNNVQFWQYAPTPPIAAKAAKETTG